jgi:hypothetical protein
VWGLDGSSRRSPTREGVTQPHLNLCRDRPPASWLLRGVASNEGALSESAYSRPIRKSLTGMEGRGADYTAVCQAVVGGRMAAAGRRRLAVCISRPPPHTTLTSL